MTYKKLTYDSSKVQVESAIRDDEGVKISTNYVKKSEMPFQLIDTTVEFVANTDASTSTDYPYRAAVTINGITANTYAEVIYSDAQNDSGDYANFCVTDTDTLYLYARSNVGEQQIPTISIGMERSLVTDSTPTSGSANPISSGGVYTALSSKADDNAVVKLTGNQTIAGLKTFTGDYLTFQDADPDLILMSTSNYTSTNGSPGTLRAYYKRPNGNSTTDQYVGAVQFHRDATNSKTSLHLIVRNYNADTTKETSRYFSCVNQDDGLTYLEVPNVASPFQITHKTFDVTQTQTTTQYTELRFMDIKGVRTGAVEYRSNADGTSQLQFGWAPYKTEKSLLKNLPKRLPLWASPIPRPSR